MVDVEPLWGPWAPNSMCPGPISFPVGGVDGWQAFNWSSMCKWRGKNQLEVRKPQLWLHGAANEVMIQDGIDRWCALDLPPLGRVPCNPTTPYTSAIKPANAKARQTAGALRTWRQPNGFSLCWEKKLAAKGLFGLEEWPESNASALAPIPRRGMVAIAREGAKRFWRRRRCPICNAEGRAELQLCSAGRGFTSLSCWHNLKTFLFPNIFNKS